MKLYHGSNIEVIEPKIIKSNRALDLLTFQKRIFV